MLWIQIGILVTQVIIVLVSYFTIHRHRVVYGIDTAVLRLPQGGQSDIGALRKEHINKLLTDGKHTILHVAQRPDKDLELILGKIKK